jgi:DNA-binding response OmpR family regulator
MLTAKAEEVDRIIGKVIGANVYLTKPFEIDELLKAVRQFATPTL